jgi:hypothetical protein
MYSDSFQRKLECLYSVVNPPTSTNADASEVSSVTYEQSTESASASEESVVANAEPDEEPPFIEKPNAKSALVLICPILSSTGEMPENAFPILSTGEVFASSRDDVRRVVIHMESGRECLYGNGFHLCTRDEYAIIEEEAKRRLWAFRFDSAEDRKTLFPDVLPRTESASNSTSTTE